jgi:two-component system LytT family response regulator
MSIRTLIVDDERNNQQTLELLLEDIDVVKVVGKAAGAEAARAMVAALDPQLIFLDINMPGEDGFQFLESIPERNFEVIFVSAYNDYGIRALKASAADYLLKPVSYDELVLAVEKVTRILSGKAGQQMDLQRSIIDNLIQNTKLPPQAIKIALPHVGGISFINLEDISYLQADSNYTILHRVNLQKLVVSKTLKDFEDILQDKGFMRVHKSNIVNLRYVKEFSTLEGGIIRMHDGGEVCISRRMQDAFLKQMGAYSVGFKK